MTTLTKPYWKQLEERIAENAKNQKYQSLSELDAKLHRPDQIIGSRKCIKTPQYIYDQELGKIIFDERFPLSAGLYKLFDEVLTNAIDHKVRMDTEWFGQGDKVQNIWINLDLEKNIISVKNDGMGISHGEMLSSDGKTKRIIEQIFTSPNSSSNYDDSGSRLCGGRNGLGVKAATIFSKYLKVRCVTNGKVYEQLYENNGSVIHTPSITTTNEKDSTTVTFAPDLEYLSCVDGIKSMIPVFMRRILDVSILFDDINIYLNGMPSFIKNLTEYAKLFADDIKEIKILEMLSNINTIENKFRIAIFPTPEKSDPIRLTLVNGVTVTQGLHIKSIIDKFYTLIKSQLQKFVKKDGLSFMTPAKIKSKFSFVAVIFISNPAFDSQTKECLAMDSNELQDLKNFLKSIQTNIIVDFLRHTSFIQSLEKDIVIEFEKKLRKDQKLTDGVKSKHIGNITGYVKANHCGGHKSRDCQLFIAEGKSASGPIVEARRVFGKDGSDLIGIFAIGGKPINPRQHSPLTINQNEVFLRLKKILGLSIAEKYDTEASLNKLNYGKVVIVSDADDDGIHITGLIINLLTYHWPAFLKNGFITRLNTPCIRAFFSKKESIDFYSTSHFVQWAKNSYQKPKEIRYYKGLASNETPDFEHIFKNFDKNLIQFKYDDKTNESLKLAFDTDSNPRKKWLISGKNDTNVEVSFDNQNVTYTDFIHKHYKTFGFRANVRAIPNICDGLKPSQRKVIFTMLNNNMNKPTKLLVVTSRVTEKTLYHHGDASMHATIIHMAQDFVGSNNINLLMPHGYFGTRQYGTKAKNAGSPRYISTSLHPITKTIFHPDDIDLMERLIEEDTKVEPITFITTVPLILINGCTGIGMGFKSDVPKYHPVDIVKCLRYYIETDKLPTKDNNIIRPCWRKSECQLNEQSNRIYLIASYVIKNPNILIINDVIPMIWIDKYIKYLDRLLEYKVITDYHNYTTTKENNLDTKFTFQITVSEDYLNGKIGIINRTDKETNKRITEVCRSDIAQPMTIEKIEKDFMLYSSVSTDSMHLIDSNGKIKKYNNKFEILSEFIQIRMKYYQKRYDLLLEKLKKKYTIAKSKYLFIMMIINGELEVRNRSKNDIIKDIETKIEKVDDSYEYLFTMKIDAVTNEKAKKYETEFNDLQKEYDLLKSITPKDLWTKDLDSFEIELKKSFPDYYMT